MHRPDPKKVAPIVLAVLIIGGGLWWWFSRQAQNGVIKASGTIEAVEVVIAPELAGRVTAINVSEGQAATAGQVLATLDDSLLKAQRSQTAASLALAESNFNSMKDGASAQQLASNVSRAEKELIDAQRALEDLNSASPLSLAQAEKDLAQAKDALDKAQDDLSNLINPDLDYYQRQLNKAQDALNSAQEQTTVNDIGLISANLKTARDLLKKFNDDVIKETMDAIQSCVTVQPCPDKQVVWLGKGMKLQDARDIYTGVANNVKVLELQLTQAQRANQIALDDTKKRLDDAKINYNDAKSPDSLKVSIAKSNVDVAKGRVADAQRNYDKVKNGVDPDKLASAKARVESAKASLASAKAAYESDRMRNAQAQLDVAQAAVKILDVQISKLSLTAPVAGTILSRAVEPGEFVSPGASLFVIADLNRLTITVYVPEDRYGQIKLEQKANVSVDSFPDQTFVAVVTHIANRAEFTPRNVQTAEGRKMTVFAIKLSIENPDGKLKPGMPADVTFSK